MHSISKSSDVEALCILYAWDPEMANFPSFCRAAQASEEAAEKAFAEIDKIPLFQKAFAYLKMCYPYSDEIPSFLEEKSQVIKTLFAYCKEEMGKPPSYQTIAQFGQRLLKDQKRWEMPDLRKAVREKDVREVQLLLSLGNWVSCGAVRYDREDALYDAICVDDVPLTHLLLGKEKTWIDHRRGDLLCAAARNNSVNALRILLEPPRWIKSHRFDPFWVSLLEAIENGHLEAVQILLQEGGQMSEELRSHLRSNPRPIEEARTRGYTAIAEWIQKSLA